MTARHTPSCPPEMTTLANAMADDVRFKNHGLAPKSAADFAFLLHGFHFLKDEGVMAIILPHGVLFRDAAAIENLRKVDSEEQQLSANTDLMIRFLKEPGL